MAVERALAAASANQFLFFTTNHSSSSSSSSSSSRTSNPIFSLPLKSRTKSLRRLRYSPEFNRNGYNQSVYPKPIEVPWKKELCNSVQLIGNVGAPIEIKHLPSGKVVARTSIAVRKSPTEVSWINLIFWEELAHVAYEHVQKGQQISISGRLISETVESDNGKQQTYCKVVVQQLNFIERTISPTPLYDHDYSNVTTGRNPSNGTTNNQKSVEEMWQAFFANPVEWWDNRKNKRSPNHPDFKHKDSGEALWIEGKYNPPWVKSQLAILDKRMGSSSSFQDRRDSRRPDFIQF